MRRWRLYEWDMDFGDLLYSEIYTSEEEAWEVLKAYIRDAIREGWDCYYDGSGRYFCTKCDEEGCYNRELGVEPA
jgi:hypothetical protein